MRTGHWHPGTSDSPPAGKQLADSWQCLIRRCWRGLPTSASAPAPAPGQRNLNLDLNLQDHPKVRYSIYYLSIVPYYTYTAGMYAGSQRVNVDECIPSLASTLNFTISQSVLHICDRMYISPPVCFKGYFVSQYKHMGLGRSQKAARYAELSSSHA